MKAEIKADELMIGNYIYAEVGLPSINIHAVLAQDILDINNGLCKVGPIPLNPEILKKCGFEEVYKSPMHSTYWIENLSYYFWHEKKKQYAECKGIQISIKYLHQLQNLYFALTGTHLTINP